MACGFLDELPGLVEVRLGRRESVEGGLPYRLGGGGPSGFGGEGVGDGSRAAQARLEEAPAVQCQGQRAPDPDVSEGSPHVGDIDVDGAEALAEVEGPDAAGAQRAVALGGDEVSAVDLTAEHGLGARGGVAEEAEHRFRGLGLRSPVAVEAPQRDRLPLVPLAELVRSRAGEPAGGAVVPACGLDPGPARHDPGGGRHVLGELRVGPLQLDGDLERPGLVERGDVLEDLRPRRPVVRVHLPAEAEQDVVGGHDAPVVEAHAVAQVVHPGQRVGIGRLPGKARRCFQVGRPPHQALAHIGEDHVLRVVERGDVVERRGLRVERPGERVDPPLRAWRARGQPEVGTRARGAGARRSRARGHEEDGGQGGGQQGRTVSSASSRPGWCGVHRRGSSPYVRRRG